MEQEQLQMKPIPPVCSSHETNEKLRSLFYRWQFFGKNIRFEAAQPFLKRHCIKNCCVYRETMIKHLFDASVCERSVCVRSVCSLQALYFTLHFSPVILHEGSHPFHPLSPLFIHFIVCCLFSSTISLLRGEKLAHLRGLVEYRFRGPDKKKVDNNNTNSN